MGQSSEDKDEDEEDNPLRTRTTEDEDEDEDEERKTSTLLLLYCVTMVGFNISRPTDPTFTLLHSTSALLVYIRGGIVVDLLCSVQVPLSQHRRRAKPRVPSTSYPTHPPALSTLLEKSAL